MAHRMQDDGWGKDTRKKSLVLDELKSVNVRIVVSWSLVRSLTRSYCRNWSESRRIRIGWREGRGGWGEFTQRLNTLSTKLKLVLALKYAANAAFCQSNPLSNLKFLHFNFSFNLLNLLSASSYCTIRGVLALIRAGPDNGGRDQIHATSVDALKVASAIVSCLTMRKPLYDRIHPQFTMNQLTPICCRRTRRIRILLSWCKDLLSTNPFFISFLYSQVCRQIRISRLAQEPPRWPALLSQKVTGTSRCQLPVH